MCRWGPLWVVSVLLGCSGKADTAAAEPNRTDEVDTGEASVGCTGTEGDLSVAITIDGETPVHVDPLRVLIQDDQSETLEVTVGSDAVAEVSLAEGMVAVTAVALDDSAVADWQDTVVLACSHTHITVEMWGLGR